MATTISVASATRGTRLAAIAAFCAVAGLGLTGCGTGATNILGEAGGIPEGQIADNSTGIAQPASLSVSETRVTIAPVIGAPENVASQLTAQLTQSLSAKGVSTVDSGLSQYTLRGYVVAARERTGTKVSYIWDVTDPKGKRVHRITGEEVVAGSQSNDPWAAVSSDVIASIVNKTATEVGSWLPTQTPPATSPSSNVASANQGTGASGATRVASAGNTTTTGSLPSATVLVAAPSVSGAPGDGSTSLATALKKALADGGATVTPGPDGRAYRVNGKVDVGRPNAGKQPIQIDWVVLDANGTNLGTVTQKNEIPAGSLDGAWGQTADAAASAAAQGILRLMKQSATN